jgi:hypothetical protein
VLAQDRDQGPGTARGGRSPASIPPLRWSARETKIRDELRDAAVRTHLREVNELIGDPATWRVADKAIQLAHRLQMLGAELGELSEDRGRPLIELVDRWHEEALPLCRDRFDYWFCHALWMRGRKRHLPMRLAFLEATDCRMDQAATSQAEWSHASSDPFHSIWMDKFRILLATGAREKVKGVGREVLRTFGLDGGPLHDLQRAVAVHVLVLRALPGAFTLRDNGLRAGYCLSDALYLQGDCAMGAGLARRARRSFDHARSVAGLHETVLEDEISRLRGERARNPTAYDAVIREIEKDRSQLADRASKRKSDMRLDRPALRPAPSPAPR